MPLPTISRRRAACALALLVPIALVAGCADDPVRPTAPTRAAASPGALAVPTPPPASVTVQVQVPASMRSAPFDVPRTLVVPSNFTVAVMARVPGARFLAAAPNGDVLVSVPGAGRVVLVRPRAGADPRILTFASGLRRPHDLVFHTIGTTTYLYVAESHQVARYTYAVGDSVGRGRQVILTGLPDASLPELGGRYGHQLKNIALHGNVLYVSIASTCNVCTSDRQATPERAAIHRYAADGTGGRVFARGLRNAEGLAIAPGTSTLWVTVNGRDHTPYPFNDASGNWGRVLPSYVDAHPPEMLTSVRDGGDYGWPYCNPSPDSPSGYDDMPYDADYDFNRLGAVSCAAMTRAVKGIEAHSAPLGLSFLTGSRFPAAYQPGAVVALHGSWNRTTPNGTKVVYFPWDATTQRPGAVMDLVRGWLVGSSRWGRPVDAVVSPTGDLLVSDDMSGTIYRLAYQASTPPPPSGGNQPPVARFTWTCNASHVCQFNSSASTDDGGIVKRRWNWGDGTPQQAGQNPQHAYARAGTYTVTLTVWDGAGLVGSLAQPVAVP